MGLRTLFNAAWLRDGVRRSPKAAQASGLDSIADTAEEMSRELVATDGREVGRPAPSPTVIENPQAAEASR